MPLPSNILYCMSKTLGGQSESEKDVVAIDIVASILENLDTRYISIIICNPLHIAKLALNVLDQRDQDEETIAERKGQQERAEKDLKTFEIMEKFVKLPYRNSFLGLMNPISRKHLLNSTEMD